MKQITGAVNVARSRIGHADPHETKTAKPRAHAAPRLLRALSLHEMAVLLLPASAPVEATAGTPDYFALQSDGPVDVVETRFALSDSRKALLQLLEGA
ncbi:hypothetical protein VSR34_15095 [Paraburkholderia sp. JHI2823]|uniref:hypothetical protein n=1 Tax=Paraburkholderia sp. JHI2823 TaxID=3112960 RepID=UPI00317C6EF9